MPFMLLNKDNTQTLATLAVSVLLHGVLVYQWLNHHPAPADSAAQLEMTVDLVAAEPEPEPAPVPPPPPEPAKPEPPPEPEAEIPKPVPKPVPKKPQPERPPEPPRPTPPPQPVAPPPAAEPVIIPPSHEADYLHNPHPEYPSISRRMGEEGQVLLHIQVSADGRPSNIQIKKSSGFPRLDDAARKTVERWRFVPAKRGSEAIASEVDVPIKFSLQK